MKSEIFIGLIMHNAAIKTSYKMSFVVIYQCFVNDRLKGEF